MKPVLLSLATLAVVGLALAAPPPPDLTGFRTWHRATKTPFPMDEAVSGLCRASPRLEDFWKRLHGAEREYERSIHTPQSTSSEANHRYFVHVYVNEIGKESISLTGNRFPVGSVIVKEKFLGNRANENGLKLGESTVLTVMRKREAGFDTKNGDWEYFIGDPKNGRLTPPDKKALKTCQSCHARYRDRDFVTKVYLHASYPKRFPK
jgi:hypothetical protein